VTVEASGELRLVVVSRMKRNLRSFALHEKLGPWLGTRESASIFFFLLPFLFQQQHLQDELNHNHSLVSRALNDILSQRFVKIHLASTRNLR
jgi:hypothetical protein